MRDGGAEAGQQEQTEEDRDPGSLTHSLTQPIHVSDTAVTSQDGSSLEFVAATTGKECYIQDARGRGLCFSQWGKGHI